MTEDQEHQLGMFLREVANWDWEAFCRAEHDESHTSNESVIFALIRACVMEKMDAIKLALHRLDGKLKTPVRIEMPKVYFLYPCATPLPEGESQPNPDLVYIEAGDVNQSAEIVEPEKPEEIDLSKLTIRETLKLMGDHPRQIPKAIIMYAEATQQWLNNPNDNKEPVEKPMVKSVVAAHLLHLAQSRDIAALSEVFDQIDGKLVETIQILGDDIFITDYSLTAPPGAYLNKDGVMQIEATQAQNIWAEKLGK